VLAAMHSVDLEKTGLSDYGRPGNYYARQFGRWTKQYRASVINNIQAMEKLIDWLEQNIPDDDGLVSLSHGDYKLDNVIFDKQNQNIIAVLDWELSTLGHPYADLAYHCMTMRFPVAATGMTGLTGLDRSALGIPTEEEYVAMYCERMGLSGIDNWTFYLAFSFFRLAAIAQGVAKRAADGNASSKQAAQVGAFVAPLASMALQAIKE
jgi:aminoglycoside phosphotransferase (APT) family kinase protein